MPRHVIPAGCHLARGVSAPVEDGKLAESTVALGSQASIASKLLAFVACVPSRACSAKEFTAHDATAHATLAGVSLVILDTRIADAGRTLVTACKEIFICV